MVSFLLTWIQKLQEQSPEVRDGALHEKRTGPAIAWLGRSASVLVAGILLYFWLGLDKEDERLRQFCDKALGGTPLENVAAKARQLAVDVRELQDSLLIMVPGKLFGQSCFIEIVEGKVSDVHSVVTHWGLKV